MKLDQISKVKTFKTLLDSVYTCDLCSRMGSRQKVLSKYNGSLYSKVLFIAEAPGRLGAEKSGIPLYGDKSGDNFDTLLANIGWARNDIFVTNSILCNPQDDKGNNSTPTKNEISNCNYYLEMTLNLINPDVIVTIGAKALEALKIITMHSFTLKSDAGDIHNWNNKKLYPLYHTGPRAMIHRPAIQQRSDFIKLSNYVDPIKGIKNKRKTKESKYYGDDKLLNLVQIILQYYKEISMFKLTKLLYLIDYNCLRKTGHSVTGSIYLRLQQGPWLPSLKALINSNKNIYSIAYSNRKPYISSTNAMENYSLFDDEEKHIIVESVEKYYNYNDGNIKTIAYLTEPMKYILNMEKQGMNMNKVPVIYKDDTVIEIHKKKIEVSSEHYPENYV